MALKRAVVLLFFQVIIRLFGDGVSELSYNFYGKSCPQVESIVREELATIFLTDPTTPAALLRLLFHDCQVKGCDASILLEDSGATRSSTSEMASGKNFGIRKTEVIGVIKSTVETMCPGVVSCADLLVLAAREAVAVSGGPAIQVPLGRRDSPNTSKQLADASLPPAATGVDDMLHIFAEKGMTVEESVAILGAHTLGVSHCVNIEKGIFSDMRRSGLEAFLSFSCPEGSSTVISNSSFVGNDLTALAFDNQYYRDLVNGGGLLRVDYEMSIDRRTAPAVQRFAVDQNYFFQKFTSAFLRLSSSGVLSGDQGRILNRCSGF